MPENVGTGVVVRLLAVYGVCCRAINSFGLGGPVVIF